MATFQAVYEQLMRMVNRPLSETDVLSGAKEAINEVIIELQRDHAYAYTEGIASFTYPVNTLLIDIGPVCGGTVRDFISLQGVSEGRLEGKPIKLVSYNQLQGRRSTYERKNGIPPDATFEEDMIGLTIEDSFRNDKVAFISGSRLGLYPRVGTAADFVIHCHIWLPELANDGDSNFFTTYARDLVIMKALKRMHIYMKSDSRYPFTNEEVQAAVQSLLAWDSQVSEAPGTSIR